MTREIKDFLAHGPSIRRHLDLLPTRGADVMGMWRGWPLGGLGLQAGPATIEQCLNEKVP